ncbi:MAG: type II secretion system F family protein, partial [Bryobacterales bacterium]|nr:type II secretion system F family protein [Bryobacterales bacterium]
RLDLQQFVVFNAQLLALIRAGMPIPQSLQLLAGNIRNKALAAHIAAVRDQVQVGASLSEAFAARKAFPPIYVTSLLAGERSGALDAVLERYVEYQKLSLAIRKKILVSLIYPTILVALVLALVVFLVTYVVPEFAQLYETMDANLPVSTQLLVALGAAARDNALALLAAAAAASAAVTWALRREGRTRLDRLLLRVPVAGQLWIRYQVAQLARLLSTLLSGGVPLVRALETASESLGSGLLQGKLDAVRAKVREGQTLAASLQQADVFPPLSVEMVRVGESTGALPQMLVSVAEFFDEEVQTKTAALLNLIEPAIMVFMGIFVAFVLISLYLPVFSLAEQF